MFWKSRRILTSGQNRSPFNTKSSAFYIAESLSGFSQTVNCLKSAGSWRIQPVQRARAFSTIILSCRLKAWRLIICEASLIRWAQSSPKFVFWRISWPYSYLSKLFNVKSVPVEDCFLSRLVSGNESSVSSSGQLLDFLTNAIASPIFFD